MPLQATSGAASYDAFGGGVAAVPNYIEECFATHLYTGNNSTQTITNGIDLSTKGGLVWLKSRSSALDNVLFDTARGTSQELRTNSTNGNISQANGVTAFNTTGFNLGNYFAVNGSSTTYASWTFRKQPKFFDCVTYTGDGTANRNVAHSINGTVGAVFIKRTNNSSNWNAACRDSSGNARFLMLNRTDAASSTVSSGWFNNNTFKVGTSEWPSSLPSGFGFDTNGTGDTYVAYIFAHNAGGFGLTGTDNVISCGSYTGTGAAGLNVTLGYEPQWVLIKRATGGTGNWHLIDVMRGWPNSTSSSYKRLRANLSDAEDDGGAILAPTATGFTFLDWTEDLNASGGTYIYIAIRRGPMKVPTTGTSVFGMYKATSATSPSLVSSFPVDMLFTKNPASSGYSPFISSRLTSERRMNTGSTAAEATDSTFDFDYQNGALSVDVTDYQGWMYRRAPGFFDVVCYTGTGSARTVAHNLAAVPELMIVKSRSSGSLNWIVYNAASGNTKALLLDTTDADFTSSAWNNTTPTSSVFSTGATSGVNNSGQTFVAYLFASCPGVSKVFNFTGNGSSQTINCGFTGGARFVMIKRTDSTGDWYVWDTARGIVANNDPHLSLNTTAAEVTSNDTIDTDSTGFVVNQVSATNVNVNGASYIGLAIA
jgi:hypothetical protein